MLGEVRAAGLQFKPSATDCFTRVDRRNALAARAHAKGRWQQFTFFLPDCSLRQELDNHTYPPARRWRVLWPCAARKPGDHAFGGTVYVHRSVQAKQLAGKRRYRVERLARCSDYAGRRGRLAVEPVDDLPIK